MKEINPKMNEINPKINECLFVGVQPGAAGHLRGHKPASKRLQDQLLHTSRYRMLWIIFFLLFFFGSLNLPYSDPFGVADPYTTFIVIGPDPSKP